MGHDRGAVVKSTMPNKFKQGQLFKKVSKQYKYKNIVLNDDKTGREDKRIIYFKENLRYIEKRNPVIK